MSLIDRINDVKPCDPADYVGFDVDDIPIGMMTPSFADALAREEPWGVWGGQLLSGGRIIANKRPCGRPPKQPRVEVLIDELGQVTVSTADVDRLRRKPEPTRRRREGSVASAG